MPAPEADGPRNSRRALATAYQDVLKADQERLTASRRVAGPRRPWFAIVSLALLAGTAGWLAVERPTWLFPPAVAEDPTRDDAGLRLTMYAAATRLNTYRSGAGRYPARLEDVPGVTARDLRYERQNDSTFVLRGRRGSANLTLHSRESLEPFLGTSLARMLPRSGR